jgi:hypothetical protein
LNLRNLRNLRFAVVVLPTVAGIAETAHPQITQIAQILVSILPIHAAIRYASTRWTETSASIDLPQCIGVDRAFALTAVESAQSA